MLGFTILLIGMLALADAQAKFGAVRLAADETITVDGRLDEAIWRRAPIHDEFIQYDPPADGAPARVRTTVQIAYDEKALYVAVQAFDPAPDGMRAPYVRRDKVFRDQDFVVLFLDPIGLRKSAQFFRVNARGAIGDGLYTADTGNEDFSPDFDFDAASDIGAEGYVVEFRIPWASLRFTHDAHDNWRLMVGRRWPRDQNYLLLSAPLKREQPNFIAEAQLIEGLSGPPTEWAWQAQPTLTARRQQESPDDPTTRRTQLEAGIDLKIRPSAEWVIDATINPDFSQVELDVPQLSRNTQFALFLTEKRPFFLESRDLYELPSNALYTRSISDPRWGTRVTFRGAQVAGLALATLDAGGGLVLLPGPFATGFAAQPKSSLMTGRIRWAVDGGAIGALALDRRYENATGSLGSNAVGGFDGIWIANAQNRVRAQWLRSATDALPTVDGSLARGRPMHGDYIDVYYGRNVERSDLNLRLLQVGSGFRNDSGFTTQAGYRSASFDVNRKWFGLAGLNEFTPYWIVNRAESMSATVISQELTQGLFVLGGRGLEIDAQLQPLKYQRVSPIGPLHHTPKFYIRSSALPSAKLAYINGSIDIGRRVDVAADRTRPSFSWLLEARLRLTNRLEFEPRFEQGILRGAQGRALTETAAQLLGVYHLGARDSLRTILQRSQAVRAADADAGIASFDDRRTTISLVYAHRRSSSTVFYLGATTARNDASGTRSTSSELFAKAQFGL